MKLSQILAEPINRHVCFIDGDGAPPAPEPAADPEADALADVLAEGEPEPQDDDEAELEIGPDKVKVKKVVKDAWDGLQKSVQTRAEEIKAEKAQVAQERQRAQEYQSIVAVVNDDLVELKSIDKQIEPYLKLTPADWMAWAEQDPEAARKAQTGLQAMLMQRGIKAQAIQGKITETQAKQKADETAFQQKAEADVAAKIKDWSPAKKAELTKAAVAHGFTEAEVAPYMYDHRTITILQKAAAYDAAMARAKAKTVGTAPDPQPTPRMRATGTRDSSGLGDNVPIDQWARNFNKMRRGG